MFVFLDDFFLFIIHGTRYDLNALFTKAFGDFTVNVQGLSRVCCLVHKHIIIIQLIRTGDVPSKSILLGTQGCEGQLQLTDTQYCQEQL